VSLILYLKDLSLCKLYKNEGKPEGKRPLGRPRRRWENNVKMDFQEEGGGWGVWTGLIRLRIGTGGGLL
jgi:hypothetical protein